MKSEYQHNILVVVQDEKIGKLFENIFQTEKVNPVFVNRGDLAIQEIKKAERPFSVIIADQSLEGMTGKQVLEQAKSLTPDSTRMLMSSHSKIDTIINAVNKGAIQSFIVKPWTVDSLEKAIKSSIKLYDLSFEDKKLLIIAKKQSRELYEFGKELMKTGKRHKKESHELDKEIETLHREIKDLSLNKPGNPVIPLDRLIDEMESHVKTDKGVDSEKIKTLFNDTIKGLYDKFNDLSYRSGFEMPDIKGEIK